MSLPENPQNEIEFSFSPSHIEISEVKYPEQQGIAMP